MGAGIFFFFLVSELPHTPFHLKTVAFVLSLFSFLHFLVVIIRVSVNTAHHKLRGTHWSLWPHSSLSLSEMFPVPYAAHSLPIPKTLRQRS